MIYFAAALSMLAVAPSEQVEHITASALGLRPIGDIQFLDGVVVTAPQLRGLKLKVLVRTQSARLSDGRILHWRARGDFRDIEGLDFAPPVTAREAEQLWQTPVNPPIARGPAPVLKGCRLFSSVESRGQFIGAWRCGRATYLATAAPRPGRGWSQATVLASLDYRFDLIGSEPVIHERGAPIVLVRLEPNGRFHYARLYWAGEN